MTSEKTLSPLFATSSRERKRKGEKREGKNDRRLKKGREEFAKDAERLTSCVVDAFYTRPMCSPRGFLNAVSRRRARKGKRFECGDATRGV